VTEVFLNCSMVSATWNSGGIIVLIELITVLQSVKYKLLKFI